MNQHNNSKKIKYQLTRKEIIWFSIISTIILFIPFLLSFPTVAFSLNDTGLANIGMALSITAPFISIGSSILVYMAFKAQTRANNQITKQFEQQNSDNIFFKLIDTVRSKIEISQIEKESNSYTGLQAFLQILKEFKMEIDDETYSIGKNIILNHIDKLDTKFHTNRIESLDFSGDILISDLIAKLNGEVINDVHKEMYMNGVIIKIGKHHFYQSDFSARKDLYERVYERIFRRFGGIIENYIITIKSLLYFIYDDENIQNKYFYLKYFRDNITGIERALIFYYCNSSQVKEDFKDRVIWTEILYHYDMYSSHLYNMMNETDFNEQMGFTLQNRIN